MPWRYGNITTGASTGGGGGGGGGGNDGGNDGGGLGGISGGVGLGGGLVGGNSPGAVIVGVNHWQFRWYQRAATKPAAVTTTWGPGWADDLQLGDWEASRADAEANGNANDPMWVMLGSADRLADNSIRQTANTVIREFGAEYAASSGAITGSETYDADAHQYVRFTGATGRTTPWLALQHQRDFGWVHITTDYLVRTHSSPSRVYLFDSEIDLNVYRELRITIHPFRSWSLPRGWNTPMDAIIYQTDADLWAADTNNDDTDRANQTYQLRYDDQAGMVVGLYHESSPTSYPNSYREPELWSKMGCSFKFLSAATGREQPSEHVTGMRYYNISGVWSRAYFSLRGR